MSAWTGGTDDLGVGTTITVGSKASIARGSGIDHTDEGSAIVVQVVWAGHRLYRDIKRSSKLPSTSVLKTMTLPSFRRANSPDNGHVPFTICHYRPVTSNLSILGPVFRWTKVRFKAAFCNFLNYSPNISVPPFSPYHHGHHRESSSWQSLRSQRLCLSDNGRWDRHWPYGSTSLSCQWSDLAL